jgi:uncharacterized protein YdaU (DUF1376 family)
MSGVPFFQFYPSDYLADTAHLSTEQHGAYLLLLITAWSRGGWLPAEPKKLARIARVSPRRWHLIADDLMEFFDEEDGQIVSRRMERDYQKAVSKSEKRSASGKRGGQAKALKNNETGLAIASGLPCHLPEPEPYSKKETKVSSPKAKKRIAYSQEFEDFWKAYPDTTNNSKSKAFEEWKKLEADDRDAAMRALPVYRAFLAKPDSPKAVKHAERFLRDRRFDSLQPGPVSLIHAEPVELPDTLEGKFMLAAREAGFSEVRIRSWLGRFTIERLGEKWACVVASREQEFQEWFADLIKAKGLVVYPESYAAKRRAA